MRRRRSPPPGGVVAVDEDRSGRRDLHSSFAAPAATVLISSARPPHAIRVRVDHSCPHPSPTSHQRTRPSARLLRHHAPLPTHATISPPFAHQPLQPLTINFPHPRISHPPALCLLSDLTVPRMDRCLATLVLPLALSSLIAGLVRVRISRFVV